MAEFIIDELSPDVTTTPRGNPTRISGNDKHWVLSIILVQCGLLN